MKKRIVAPLVAAVAIVAMFIAVLATPAPQQAAAVGTDSTITASGAGVFPAGANVSGIQLAGGTFAIGVQSSSTGSAVGDLEVQYNGTSVLGMSQWITVTGWITTATVNADGSVTFNGTATLDLGDGTAPTGGVSLVATLGPAGLAVTAGGTTFPTLPKSDGWFTVE